MSSSGVARHNLNWGIWLVLAALALSGLRNYRVDNSLDAWMPELHGASGSPSYLVVGWETPPAYLAEVTQRLRALSTVQWCIEVAALDEMASGAIYRAASPASEAMDDYAGLFVFRAEGVNDDRFVSEVLTVLEESNAVESQPVAVGGPAAFHVALNRWSQDRLPLITGLIALTGFLVTWGVTRRWWVAASGTAAILLSQVVLLGAATAIGQPVDMSLSLVPPLMMALGYSYAIHRALRPAVGLTLVVCLLTTMAGVGAFALTGLPPIKSFALFGMGGLVLVWLAVIMLVPAAKQGHAGLETDQENDTRQPWPWRRPGTIIIAAALITAFGALGALNLRFETDPLRYFPPDAQIVRDYDTLNTRLTGMLPFQIVVEGDADPTAMLRATQGVRRVIDMAILGPSRRGEYWCLADNDALPQLMAAREDWAAWAIANDSALQFTGVAAQLGAIGGIVARTAVATLPAMALIAMMAGGIVARSFVFALASLWVNLLPIAMLMLAAWACNLRLDLPSLMIGAITIGVALDDTVHLAASFRARGSMLPAWRECRSACAGSSLAVATCLSLFLLSQFGPTAQFGGLMALAVVGAVAGDLLVLPAVVAFADSPRRSRTVDAAPSH